MEEKYLKILEMAEKKYDEKLSHVQLEYENKILARKDAKSIRDSSSNKAHDDSPPREKEVRKWKL